MQNALPGKIALVTGGSRGIGAAISRTLAAQGARVALAYRAGAEAADALVNELQLSGADAAAFRCDVTDATAVERLLADVVGRFGGLDILVNNAGVGGSRPLADCDPAFFHALMDGNVLSMLQVTRAALPHLRSPGGRVVNVSSRLAYVPVQGNAVYAAAKAAVASLTLNLAKDLGPKGITINAVAPGLIETDMTAGSLPPRREAVIGATPLGRIGQPDDIAGVVLLLATEAAGWMTGQTIRVDGGIT